MSVLKKILVIMILAIMLTGCSKSNTKQEVTMGNSIEEQTAKEEPTTEQPTTEQPTTSIDNSMSLSVKGTHLVDCNGDNVVLKGVSTHGLSWFPEFVNKKAFKQARDEWGVNLIRFALFTEDYNGYCLVDDEFRKSLEDTIDNGVKYCTELGMYAIIDWHILSDANPNIHKAEAKVFFDKISRKYAGNDNVLYEICNEPNDGTTWSEIKSYAEEIIKVIRKNDKDAIIIVGTPNWSQDVDIASKNPIQEKNIMYSLHFYADSHRDEYRDKLKTAINNGLPVFVTEFGISDASGSGNVNTTEGDKWIKL